MASSWGTCKIGAPRRLSHCCWRACVATPPPLPAVLASSANLPFHLPTCSRLPSEFDATAAAVPGHNVLAVKVMRWSDGSYLEDQVCEAAPRIPAQPQRVALCQSTNLVQVSIRTNDQTLLGAGPLAPVWDPP